MSKFTLLFVSFLMLFPRFVSAEPEYTWYRDIFGSTIDGRFSSMAVDKEGNLWVLTGGKAFCFKGENWVDYTDKAGGSVRMSLSPDGILWFASHDKLIRYDGDKWEYIKLEMAKPDEGLGTLSAAPNNVVWFCYNNRWKDVRFFVRFDNGKFDVFREGFLGVIIISLTATKDGGVWIHNRASNDLDCEEEVCPKGASYFNGITFTHYLYNDTLPGYDIAGIALSPYNNDLYGLCGGRIAKFTNGKWEILYKEYYGGLIVNGGDGDIWQGSLGMFCISNLMCLKNDRLISYDVSEIEEMLFKEMTSPYSYSLAVTSDGSVWMSFEKGLLRINPNSLKVLTSVKSGNPIAISDKISCYPNPFNSTATIKYYLDKDSPVTVDVYNSLGQKIRTVLSRSMKSGFNYARWDGISDNGERVSTGFYTVVVKYSGKMMSSRVLFLK